MEDSEGRTQQWLSPEQVCEMLPGMTVRRVEYLRGKGQGPRYAKPTPKTVFCGEDDVHAWVSSSIVETRRS
ncbi:hypothetical protein N1028_02365 [Herbiconiux sp. CPCC 203407]|uniref:Uncharacterized protein n=1 Tax=Herbiconiux oxytropis TaxID=2970915 RepID=A0AA42BVP7_9MICO|nr:hypothetical protein [Herbiconiux oxytropis]MCS5721081.1 hypothetical protein [Herbiconiux oxytropis]MCS5724733.1 hypothetical protein [Herbiconiux oxytropis]